MEKTLIVMSMVWLSIATLGCYAQNCPKDYLTPHNLARAEVGVPPLVWDDGLASDAKTFLDSNLAYECELLYDIASTGINVFRGDVSFTASRAVDNWVSEKTSYDYATNSCTYDDCGFYIQVVWNTTTSVGCSRAQCLGSDSLWGTACMYRPAGNIPNVRPY